MNLNTKSGNWILLLIVSLIWGSPYILREIALKSFTHYQVAALQVFISFCLFLPLIAKNFKKLNSGNIFPLLLSGLTGNVGPSFFFAKAQTQINSSMAGMLNAMLPMVTLMVAILLFRNKPQKHTLIGIALGFGGTATLAFLGDSYGASYFWGIFYVLMAILSIAVSINLVSFSLPNLTGVEIASLAFLFVGPLAGLYLASSDLHSALAATDFIQSSTMIALLGIGTFVGVMLYNQLIKHSSHVFAASIAYIIPVVALFWGIVIGGDNISLWQIASILFILVGVNLVNRQ
ncbi:MAG: DMT family transporter [Marinifilaceae bacterium]